MTVANTHPREVLNQLEEIERIAHAVERLIDYETDGTKREAKLKKMSELKEQIEAKKAATEDEIRG